MKKFHPLSASSKFGLCGLPIRVDTYKGCSHGCKYCFANYRVIAGHTGTLEIGDEKKVKRKLKKIFDDKKVNNKNFLDVLINERITWHCGGMSDPFQPAEKQFNATKKLVDITNKYDISILFSTKGFSTYATNIKSNLHSFQLSVTNVEDKTDIEPNVAPIQTRYKFYKKLKNKGFKVGIRIQPFIPNVSNAKIVEMFHDADYFTIEGLKLVPQNKKHKKYLLKLLNLNRNWFTQMGLLNLKPEIRKKIYKPVLKKIKEYHIPFSIADNDMHYISSGKCCCGDPLIKKSTNFNTTAMAHKYGTKWTKTQLKKEIQQSKCGQCKVNHLFTSNRQEGLKTLKEFMLKRYKRKSSPFSPKFFHRQKSLFNKI